MIEHHRRVIGKPGVYHKGDRLSLTRAPITDFTLWNDEIKEGKDFEVDLKQGVITFLDNVRLGSFLAVEFKWNNPEEKRIEKRPWWKRILRKGS